MARHSALCPLLPLLLLPSALAHMQMIDPSPLRDPHSNRELKDYNMLSPLKADGSDFTCKGYQWNTPLTPVATYHAGREYNISLKGGATHNGGSCQISISCDNGIHFKVLESIVGGCPMQSSYPFTIPEDLESAICLLAWTWFNKVGNREMYMNCAVVNIVGGAGSKKASLDSRASSAASAQARLSNLPDMFVANLKSVNDCTTKESVDVNFDDPGRSVTYGDGMKAGGASTTGRKGACVGVGRKSGSGPLPANPADAGASSGSSSAGSAGGNQNSDAGSGGSTGSTAPGSPTCALNDGQWHPNGCGGASPSSAVANWDGTPAASQPSAQAVGNGMSGTDMWSDASSYNPSVPQEQDAYADGYEDNVYASSQQNVKSSGANADSKVNSAHAGISGASSNAKASKNKGHGGHYDYDYDSDAYGRQQYIPSLSDTPTSTPAPEPQSLPEQTEASAGCGGAARLSYASNDPSQYLPCKPGSFLCKSPTEFYTCKQDGDGWNYGAFRPVAAGMECKPQLAAASELKRRHLGRRQAKATAVPAKSKPKPSAATSSKPAAGDGTDDPNGAVYAFFGPEPDNYEDEWPVSDPPASTTFPSNGTATAPAKKSKDGPAKSTAKKSSKATSKKPEKVKATTTPKKSAKARPTPTPKKAKATPTFKKSSKKATTTKALKPPKKTAAKPSPSTLKRVFIRAPRALAASTQQRTTNDRQRAQPNPTRSKKYRPSSKTPKPKRPAPKKPGHRPTHDAEPHPEEENEQHRPSYPAEPGDGTDDAPEALFPGLKADDDGTYDSSGDDGGIYSPPSVSSTSLRILINPLRPTTSTTTTSSPSITTATTRPWHDGIFYFPPPPTPTPSSTASPSSLSSTSSTTTTTTTPPRPPTLSSELAASILPYFFGHGPVVPPGLSLSWPHPAVPTPKAEKAKETWPPKVPGVTGTWPPRPAGMERRWECVGRGEVRGVRDDGIVRVG